jgi:hypothetical protein
MTFGRGNHMAERIRTDIINEEESYYKWFCPGCLKKHELRLPSYSASGTEDKPTLNAPFHFEDKRKRVTCAGVIEKGIIDFSPHSIHFLSGLKEELPEYI